MLSAHTSPSESRLDAVSRKLERVSQACRNVSWQTARKNYSEALLDLARNYPVSAVLRNELENGKDVEGFIGGDEHINVRFISDTTRIFKITHNDQFGCDVVFDPYDVELTGRNFLARSNDSPLFYLKRWQLINSIGSYQSTLEGILPPERPGWMPRLCISQPFVPGAPPSQTLNTETLSLYGFSHVSLGAYYRQGDNILLTDAFPRNIRIHHDIAALFDVIASHPSSEALTWLTENKPNEST